jgi:hypothetical protein
VGLPLAAEAKLFYRAGLNRFADAELLFHHNRYTGAVYLAGYGVECMLKALILSAVPRKKRQAALAEFTGRKAHDFEWLKWRLCTHWPSGLPAVMSAPFSRVALWSTDLRYVSGKSQYGHAKLFLDSAAEIIKWIDGRL